MRATALTRSASLLAGVCTSLARAAAGLAGAPDALLAAGGLRHADVAAAVAALRAALLSDTEATLALAKTMGLSEAGYASVERTLSARQRWPDPGDLSALAGALPGAAELAAVLAAETVVATAPRPLLGVADLVAGLMPSGPGSATPTGPPEPHPTSPGSPAGWLATVTDAQAEPGRIAVSRLANGRWVVSLPGIQSLRETPAPLDLPDALVAFGTRHGDYARSVAMALTLAGAPVGASVMLVGHSEGGIVAADLAADPTFTSRWPVTHVIAVGSPIAGVRIPSATHLLAIDNDDDLVPALDLSDHVARPDRVTVTFRSELGSVGRNHSLTRVYVPFAESGSFATSPGVAGWEVGASAYLQGGPVTVQYFSVLDAPPDPGPAGAPRTIWRTA